jgi:hypothetical protein
MNLFTSSSSAPAAAVQGKKIKRGKLFGREKLKNLLPHRRNFSTLLYRRDGVSDRSSLDTDDIDVRE